MLPHAKMSKSADEPGAVRGSMIRRVVTAVAFLTAAVVLVAPPAGAGVKELYPPTPIVKVPVTPVIKREVVVIVRRVPVVRPRPLAVTGSPTLVPVAVLATGAVLFGTGIVVLTRVRRPNFGRHRAR
jgi:hypothetical protein